jgi:hypothetical protein
MNMYKRYSKKAIDALRATASSDPAIRAEAQRTMAAELQWPLRQGVFDRDNLGNIYEKQLLAPGAQANYPLDFIKPGDEDNFIAFTLPKQGRVPERHVEGDELWVPTWRISNSIDWDIRYAEEARFDVIQRAIRVYEAGFVRKINSDGWRALLGAADGRGLVVAAAGPAPFTGDTQVGTSPLTPQPGAGQFTKELISRMRTTMVRGAGGNGNAGRLTDVYLSLEAMEDIRAWDTDEIDEFTRREIFVSRDYGLASIYGVVLHEMTEFGQGQEYETFLTGTLARTHQTIGSNTLTEFCVGLDLSTMDSFVMPIRKELETYEDPNLYRQQRAGIYGWMEHGFGVLDSRRILLGEY